MRVAEHPTAQLAGVFAEAPHWRFVRYGVGLGLGLLSVDPAFQPLGEHSAPRCSAQASALAIHDPNLFAGPTSSTDSTANRLGLAGGATRGLCCGHLGRSSGASQRLGRASFTHAATTEMSGPSVEP